MRLAKIGSGRGSIRRPHASGSVTGTPAGWGGDQVSTTDVPRPGAEMISACPPASAMRARILFRRPDLAGSTPAGSKPAPSSDRVTATRPDWPRRAVSAARPTPA
jgi:hypothetical protein